MREPPALADATIVTALQASFGIGVAALVFRPIGNDSASWAYRVEAAQGPAYFLKVRAGAGPMPGRRSPRTSTALGVIGALVRQADVLGRQRARSSFPQVLCHADLHTWNVLVDDSPALRARFIGATAAPARQAIAAAGRPEACAVDCRPGQ